MYKFRAYHIKDQIIGEAVNINERGAFILGLEPSPEIWEENYYSPPSEGGRFCPHEDIEIMLYSKQRDKNNNYICEGDTVNVRNVDEDIETTCSFNGIYFDLIDNSGNSWTRQLFHYPQYLEIVGTKYDKL